MIDFLFASSAFLNQCSYNLAFLNKNDWIGICVLVVTISMMISAVMYGVSGLLPGTQREKLKGVVKYEYIQALFSLILITALFSMSVAACNIGAALTQGASGYQDPFQFAGSYIGNLMFAKGIALVGGLFSAGTSLVIDAAFANYFVSAIGNFFPSGSIPTYTSGTLSASAGVHIEITGTDEPSEIIYEYSYILPFLEGLVVVTFGLLFAAFVSLPIIEGLALTLVIPVAIIMRSLAFSGPRLRDVSNTFIAMAIAFYFVFPLTIAMNYYVVNWMYCLNGSSCNPYVAYLGPGGYLLNTLPINQLLANPNNINVNGVPSIGGISLPLNFFGADLFAGNNGLLGIIGNVVNGLENMPRLINGYVLETAQYLFQGIFLIAIDVAITVGFAVGLNRGLNSIGQLLAVGPFW